MIAGDLKPEMKSPNKLGWFVGVSVEEIAPTVLELFGIGKLNKIIGRSLPINSE